MTSKSFFFFELFLGAKVLRVRGAGDQSPSSPRVQVERMKPSDRYQAAQVLNHTYTCARCMTTNPCQEQREVRKPVAYGSGRPSLSTHRNMRNARLARLDRPAQALRRESNSRHTCSTLLRSPFTRHWLCANVTISQITALTMSMLSSAAFGVSIHSNCRIPSVPQSE